MKLIDKAVYVWTVNEERRLVKLLRRNDITAIITDKPELAMKILATLEQQRLGEDITPRARRVKQLTVDSYPKQDL